MTTVLNLNLQLEDSVKERLKKLSDASGRPVESHVAEVVSEYLGELEYAQVLKQEALDYRTGVRTAGNWDDMKMRLGLD